MKKEKIMFEIMYESDGVGICICSDEDSNFDGKSYDEYMNDLDIEEVCGGWFKIGGCSCLLSEYINIGDDEFKDKFLKWLMEYKDVDIDWDKDDEERLIRECFDGDIEKMKNWKSKEEV